MATIFDDEFNLLCEQWNREDKLTLFQSFGLFIQELVTKIVKLPFNGSSEHAYKLLCKTLTTRDKCCDSVEDNIYKSCKFFIQNTIISSIQTKTSSAEICDQRLLFKAVELSLETIIQFGDDQFCTEYVNVISNDLNSQSDSLEPNRLSLTAFECLLNAIINTRNGMHIVNLDETLNHLKNEELHKCLTKVIIDANNESTFSFVLLKIGPKLFTITGLNVIMKESWMYVDQSCNTLSNLPLQKKLTVLNGLLSFTIDSTSGFTILNEATLWLSIQEGIVSDDSKSRKYGLYLLKKSVEHIENANIEIELDIFNWKPVMSELYKSSWEQMFLILEILEEKQTHLVNPVIQNALKSIELSNFVHPSWILLVYVRVFSHDSLQVVKHGILIYLNTNIDSFLENPKFQITLEVLFQKLNNMLLFACPKGVNEWSILDESLRKWFTNVHNLPSGQRSKCVQKIVDAIVKVQWCTIPLFHVLYNMNISSENMELHFDGKKLVVLCEFLREVIRTQNKFIRGAVQTEMVVFLSKLIPQENSFCVSMVANTISVFRKNECLHRNTKTWEILVDWVKSLSLQGQPNVLKELMNEDNNLSPATKSRSLIMFVDAGLIEPKSDFQNEMKNIFSPLKEIRTRAYAPREKCDYCIELVSNIIDESNELHSNFMKEINKHVLLIDDLVDYIDIRIDEVTLEDFDKLEHYIKTLTFLSDHNMIPILKLNAIYSIAKKIVFSQKSNATQHFYAMAIILTFLKKFTQDHAIHSLDDYAKELLSNLVEGKYLFLLGNLKKDTNDDKLSKNHQTKWGSLLSGYIQMLWSTLLICIDFNCISTTQISQTISQDELVSIATNAIEVGGREALATVLNVMDKFVTSMDLNFDTCKRFLEYSLKSCFEHRKISSFWPSIKAWVKMAFRKKLIQQSELQDSICEFSEYILTQGEAISGLSNVLVSHLKNELVEVPLVKILLKSLISACLFGPIPRRDQRIENDTCALIRSLGEKYQVNSISTKSDDRSSYEVRLYALATILQVAHQEGGEQLIVEAVKQLITIDNQLTAQRQRYHGDSLHHRLKHRILQALLILESVLPVYSSENAQSCVVELLKWSSNCLQGESQQPSVRYQLEWILVRTFIHSPHLTQSFWTIFGQASEERTGSICSFISVAYHLAVSLNDSTFTERCITEILPWCMAQHFNVRLYAQVVIQKLWPLDSVLANKYGAIRNSLMKSLNHGNAVRNAEKLKNDFYFTSFHSINHFTFETILWELPRLSNISRDEWVPVESQAYILSELNMSVPLLNPDDTLKQFSAASWVVKATNEAEPDMEAFGMQKKFVPWKNMFPEFEETNESSIRTELIVVASLIDKMPNLGGLARTCEIFAVDSLVVPSLEYTQDKLFSTLSMSAEKHINMVEVKPHDLSKFLNEKKSFGYTLVGAEQTASSTSLGKFKFPKKCLLLLGNEKEGVPVNLLPLLDVCVEIPQLGVVRSLNVHVTGAIFIWEYTKEYFAASS